MEDMARVPGATGARQEAGPLMWRALALTLAAGVLAGGCAGAEFYREDDLQIGRDWANEFFVPEVRSGAITKDEAHDRCVEVAKLEASTYPDEDYRETFQRAVAVGCHEALDDALD